MVLQYTQPRKDTIGITLELIDIWNTTWRDTEREREEYDLTKSDTWRIAASKTRNPEDGDWWYTAGYKFFENWVTWRNENPHIAIHMVDDKTPGIELEMAPVVAGVKVKMAIDRVMVNKDTGELYIIDLKTGKNHPRTGLQLGFYAYGLRHTYGTDVGTGYYWNARKMELSQPFNLADYDDSKIETLVSMFQKARTSGIFIPNYDSCSMCGYTATCLWYVKKEKENDEQ